MKTHELTVYFCTGARNHDLLEEFQPEIVRFEIDERMASFMALGEAKAAHQPRAICTTSGTAVAECVPALVEAYYSLVPLILISADRPKHMQGTGAPQTIDHETLTRGHRRTYLEVNRHEFAQLDFSKLNYPAHINVILASDSEKVPSTEKKFETFKAFTQAVKRPLIILSHETHSLRAVALRLREMKIPFYAESLGKARDLSLIQHEKTLIQLIKQKQIDGVIRIGHTPLSKAWRLLEEYHLPVFSFDERSMSGLSHGSIVGSSGNDLLKNQAFWEQLVQFTYFNWQEDSGHLENLISKYPLSEISLMRKVQELIPEDSDVYVGNSLVIRDFELTQKKSFKVHGNRGVNGIDGQLSTAIGMARASNSPFYCILGDLTTFYDLSSLRSLPTNLKLIIMNNDGGRIFETLKLNRRIWLEHHSQFISILKGFGLTSSQSLSDWEKAQVLELIPDPRETQSFRKEWA